MKLASKPEADKPRARAMRPRPPLTIRPAMVSNLNCLAVLGLDERRFREVLAPLCRGHVSRIGHVLMIPLDVAEARLHELADAGEAESARTADASPDDAPTTADAVLAAIGRRAAGGTR